jgi:serine/threonine-protein kinase RsbW
MESVKQRFRDLSTVIDGVHAVFDQWPEEDMSPAIDAATVHRTRLAVHEWIANLVQHSNFSNRIPDITLDLWSEGEKLICVIEDNSDGFDLDAHLVTAQEELESLPERGMGLLMLQACATDLFYGQISDGKYRLKFSVRSDSEPWLNIPF